MAEGIVNGIKLMLFFGCLSAGFFALAKLIDLIDPKKTWSQRGSGWVFLIVAAAVIVVLFELVFPGSEVGVDPVSRTGCDLISSRT